MVRNYQPLANGRAYAFGMTVRVRPIPLRVLALVIELLPLSVVLVLDGANGDDGTTIAVLLALLTGVGWFILGRWDVGFAIGLARGVLLVFAAVLLGFPLFAVADCWDCNPLLGYVLLGVIVGLYVLTTLTSAVMLAWHAWRVPSWINRRTQ